ncbi:MAG: hypothetical protein S4CHLAM2_06810 [Chlamydiales bacterium]|nr:hypothetical protein [Chlamydiales bacterium]
MSEPFIILLIENDQSDLQFIQRTFEHLQARGIKFNVTVVSTLRAAHGEIASETSFDLIITNLYLEDCQGIEIIRSLRKSVMDVPLIATAGYADEETIQQMIRIGAQDYLPQHELDPMHLHKAIISAIERNHLQQSLRALSFTDEMTGLYNRRGFDTLLKQQRALAIRNNQGFYLFLADLDYLKTINDTYGHPTGDRALMDVADCLYLAFRHHDILARIGGDEFAIIAINASIDSKESLEQGIYDQIQQLNKKTSEPYRLSLSLGAAYFNGAAPVPIEELIHEADKSLYQTKQKTHN